ncbi:YjbH domain-containing protein [Tropicimonas sp. IMCC6043]|uniref:YjbH domain-containing protein n=1 Tax=Tropicimonas sp. IMCC6043 TaxID=2510645 RepID=UPI00101C5D36|nr:YjbH domain-containing protein [Tropicimonas sp. IMCC6043]RYH10108.1 YjbH domain-containing protein [Tropicimonas sp. IMCC6043]
MLESGSATATVRGGPRKARRFYRLTAAMVGALILAGAPPLSAEDLAAEWVARPHLSFYGMPGMIDMPSGEMLPDGDAALALSMQDGRWRATLGFQFTPWLYLSHQYSYSEGFWGDSSGGESDLHDRAFGFALRLLPETRWRPSVTVGITDIAGTSVLGSEYVVATKAIGERLKLTGGIGWGRMGSFGGFDNPLSFLGDSYETRSGLDVEQRRQPASDQWFRGPAAPFGGLEWKVSESVSAILEYSSDAYEEEVARTGFERESPFNFGLTYRPRPGIDIGLYSLYGSSFGISATFTANPTDLPFKGAREPAPPPVAPRAGSAVDLSAWNLPDRQIPASAPASIRDAVARGLEGQGMRFDGLEIRGSVARVAYTNTRFDAQTQALGRAARVMAATLPPEVETFELQPLVYGMPTSTITIARSDLEELEFAPDRIWQSYVRADIADAGDLAFAEFTAGAYPQHEWSVRPFIAPPYFVSDAPLQVNVGLDFGASYTPAPGLVFSGVYRQTLAGSQDDWDHDSGSDLPHVRSDITRYEKDGRSYLSYLTAEYFFRPGPNLYGRATVGYLERMYGGVSTELLWKPTEGPLAFGAELNYARQRDFDGGFGFRDYDVVTGHVGAYYDFGEGYAAQVDVGRYLAGDYGASLYLSREFANGVRFGAFATRTDVSYEDFGEGSYDKGIFFEIPFAWVAGIPSRDGYAAAFRPVQGDGGARLDVRNRLYEIVKDFQDPELRQRWAGYWR